MNVSNRNYRRIVWASALYDLIVIAPFAFPLVSDIYLQLCLQLHHWLGQGSFPLFEPLHMLFVNLLGGVVIVWSLVRLRSPAAVFGLFDGLTRIFFCTLFLYYLLQWQVSGLVYLFLVPEALWALAQLVCYRRRFD